MNIRMKFATGFLAAFCLCAGNALAEPEKPLSLRTMGSLLFGGTVQKKPNGDTFHGDHGYAQYYIPENSRQFPLIFWHGMMQSGKTWESTPDGREGFQAIFPRNDWPVYIIDQPRRGRAGYTQSTPASKDDVPAASRESATWTVFRNGIWTPPDDATLFDVTQFPASAGAIDQFFRQQTPNTGDEPRTNEHRKYMAETLRALLDRTGESVLVTHSNSGQYGWFSAMESPERLKAVVAYEPGQFVLPENEPFKEVPTDNKIAAEVLRPILVPESEFKKLAQMPILVIFGDNIADAPNADFNQEAWRVIREWGSQFVDAVNRHGGDATLVELPEIGLKGNPHALMADKNNVDVAKHLMDWLRQKGLDTRQQPHNGPTPLKLGPATIPLQ
ncbi:MULTISPECIES: alpha/beta fold hydrolase [unclassified Desulfovibrio]|uniref:alpha/beta hydrolase n=1 Tax=unclassified Desulfovibrio TaxID=2593640 RepID=UPI0013EBC4D9|nr:MULTISPECIES: alpha/beta fold hydrolase [unclassified Desulfovibrio]